MPYKVELSRRPFRLPFAMPVSHYFELRPVVIGKQGHLYLEMGLDGSNCEATSWRSLSYVRDSQESYVTNIVMSATINSCAL